MMAWLFVAKLKRYVIISIIFVSFKRVFKENVKYIQSLLLAAAIGVSAWAAIANGLIKLPSGEGEPSASFAGDVLASINEARKERDYQPLERSAELEAWITGNVGAITPSDTGIKLLLTRLQESMPAVVTASAHYAETANAMGLVDDLKTWEAAIEQSSFTHFAIHVFDDSSWRKSRAVVVGVRMVPRFTPGLLGLDQHAGTEFYNICNNCGEAHRSQVVRSSLAVVLHCPYCEKEYDVYAMQLDGSYKRITELLSGFEPPAAFPENMTELEQLVAIWQSVLDNFRYTTDLKGAHGQQDSWQTARETCVYGNGDCEDTSIFMVDWLISRGIEARVAIGMEASGGGHAWCVARIDGEEYLIETTGGRPDIKRPPLVSKLGHEYKPVAMFDNTGIWFRQGKGWTPRYWSDTQWRKVEFKDSNTSIERGHELKDVSEILRAGLAGFVGQRATESP